MREPDTIFPETRVDAWRRGASSPSLPEVNRTIAVPTGRSFWKKMGAFTGPGYVIAVGYMDPGNWATDLAGGAQFGYTLLSIILLSSFMAILLQHLSLKLGIATGRDLAQACRDHYPKPVVIFLWVLCEIAIAACDLAEVVGMAIGLQLLFGIPLLAGCIITCLDVLIVLYLQNKGFRYLEALIMTLIVTIAACFVVEIYLCKPDYLGIFWGFAPNPEILKNQAMLYVSIGIIGATVMPHNLYLHSSIVQTRRIGPEPAAKREAIRFATIDSTVALFGATFVNSAILILAAATFHNTAHADVADIQGAYKLLTGVLGVSFASTLFACGLLASGQNSTLTGTLAGQIVMEGFLHIRLRPWLRRLVTRAIAVIPAVVIIGLYGEEKTNDLLVASQVVLSMQLGFAVWPLMRFTGDRAKMGEFVNPAWIKILGWSVTVLIIGLNAKLVLDSIFPGPWLKTIYGIFGLSGPG
jgi:manganese transport protein